MSIAPMSPAPSPAASRASSFAAAAFFTGLVPLLCFVHAQSDTRLLVALDLALAEWRRSLLGTYPISPAPPRVPVLEMLESRWAASEAEPPRPSPAISPREARRRRGKRTPQMFNARKVHALAKAMAIE